ncbi:MAG: hypothetical protein IJU94_05735 [Clostridia bacterium]|nr:hypothetical protein [Clostridia bacterium]
MAKKYKIQYYITEAAKRTRIPAFSETINGDRNFVMKWAENRLKHSQFKFYDLIEQ